MEKVWSSWWLRGGEWKSDAWLYFCMGLGVRGMVPQLAIDLEGWEGGGSNEGE